MEYMKAIEYKIQLKNKINMKILQEIIISGKNQQHPSNYIKENVRKAKDQLLSIKSKSLCDDSFTRIMINQNFCNFRSGPVIEKAIKLFNGLREEIAIPYKPSIVNDIEFKELPEIKVDYKLEDKILVCASSNTAVTTLRKYLISKGLHAIQIYALTKQQDYEDDEDSLHYKLNKILKKSSKYNEMLKRKKKLKVILRNRRHANNENKY